MGCGQSKIGIIYPRKSKSKSGSKRSGVEPDSDEEAEEADPGLGNRGDAENCDDQKAGNKVRQVVVASPGPLLAQTEISSSQMDFFKMLDEKIENGPDYDSANEEEIALERARLCALLHDWETASTNSSLNRSAPPTPAHRKLPAKPSGPPPSYYNPHVNGELFLQQQNQHSYHQQMQLQQQHQQLQQQYFQHHLQYQQHGNRGQFVIPSPPQITRVAPVMRNYQPMPTQQHASSIVQYRQSRGAYTELA